MGFFKRLDLDASYDDDELEELKKDLFFVNSNLKCIERKEQIEFDDLVNFLNEYIKFLSIIRFGYKSEIKEFEYATYGKGKYCLKAVLPEILKRDKDIIEAEVKRKQAMDYQPKVDNQTAIKISNISDDIEVAKKEQKEYLEYVESIMLEDYFLKTIIKELRRELGRQGFNRTASSFKRLTQIEGNLKTIKDIEKLEQYRVNKRNKSLKR